MKIVSYYSIERYVWDWAVRSAWQDNDHTHELDCLYKSAFTYGNGANVYWIVQTLSAHSIVCYRPQTLGYTWQKAIRKYPGKLVAKFNVTRKIQ